MSAEKTQYPMISSVYLNSTYFPACFALDLGLEWDGYGLGWFGGPGCGV